MSRRHGSSRRSRHGRLWQPGRVVHRLEATGRPHPLPLAQIGRGLKRGNPLFAVVVCPLMVRSRSRWVSRSIRRSVRRRSLSTAFIQRTLLLRRAGRSARRSKPERPSPLPLAMRLPRLTGASPRNSYPSKQRMPTSSDSPRRARNSRPRRLPRASRNLCGNMAGRR